MQVERTVVLPTTPAEAWSVLMDWERQADWMLDADSVTVVSGVREGIGVRLAVRTRLFGVPAFVEPMVVTAWDPPRRLEIRHGSMVSGVGTWSLEPVDGWTAFTWREDIELAVPFVGDLAARCYRPVMHALMGRAMEGLRRHLIALGPART
jgi:carbon monoxide dehydrogenase subunit G